MRKRRGCVINLYALTLSELSSLVVEFGEKPFRARQLWKWMYEKRVDDFAAMSDLPKRFIDKLGQNASLGSLELITRQNSADGTEKRLYQLADGQLIESVLMPYEDQRKTACLSTQAGCAMGCVFCATGQMGFARNLRAEEIFEQAMLFARELASQGERLSNIVLMGMGEPFHNYEATMQAIRQFMDRLGIGARHITVSTVGLAPQIRRFADEGLQVNLALSLHKSDDSERSALMPVNRRWPIDELISACRYYTAKTNRRITIEWAAIAGENDSSEEARKLGRLLAGLLCHVNIIPLNPTDRYSGAPAEQARIDKFRNILKHYGVASTVRLRRGIDIDAGCGQLKTNLIKLDQISG
ncbi:MAG: 23S rRNA (adenine(2503)-C(2))-methyltransferase RlmN [Chloroflexota bacterium]|nr:23S rRNA (adenine(2503)-C(2))-methyltransferase RlmN [Chloroflexota bacterium]